jgi:hypothetical protein
VRWGFRSLVLGAAGLWTLPVTAMDGPAPIRRLAMPYSCSVEHNVVVVRPSPERVFEIAGGNEERLFTTCDPPFSNNCRSLAVYKFDVACGLDRVAWPRIVAAIGRTTAGDASISKGHLILAREADRAQGHAPSCSDRSNAAQGGGECLPWRVRKPTERLVLPTGFAPLREVGGRLIDGTFPSAYAASDLMSDAAVPLPGSGPFRMTPDAGSADAFAALQQVAATAPPDKDLEYGGGWTTSLSFSAPRDAAPELIIANVSDLSLADAAPPASPFNPLLPWLALFGCLGLAALYILRMPQLRTAVPDLSEAAAGVGRNLRKIQDLAGDALSDWRNKLAVEMSEPSTLHDDTTGDPALSSAILQLRAMLARTEAAIAMLSSAAMVREVMQSELDVIRSRLDEAERAARRGSTPVMKLAAQFRQIARDIDRVQALTESASHSFSSKGQSYAMPATLAEAYATIGVDMADGEASAKRAIDALRFSTHPDHAAGETDRLEREARMKQINVAADLILRRRRPG